MLTETAYAKINLALHVRRRRDDGYHELETIFAFCEDGDFLSVTPSDILSLMIDGPFADGLSTTDNLVIRAAQAMGVTAQLHLVKNLPVASGIGGGSADAAATLRLLATMLDQPLPDLAVQRQLGADVPACVVSQTLRGEGVGERISKGGDVTGTPVLLVNPGVALSTASVFAAWGGVDGGPLGDSRAGRNDLETPARALVPVIGVLLDWLNVQPGVTCARMSGSGATCFALFVDDAARDAAAIRVAADHPDWWRLASRLR
jgi:4-diphosphocytidyl-2-C-methyl-D-erythritol kinase